MTDIYRLLALHRLMINNNIIPNSKAEQEYQSLLEKAVKAEEDSKKYRNIVEILQKLISNICVALDCGELHLVDKFLELKQNQKSPDDIEKIKIAENRLSNPMLKWVQCIKCRKNYFHYYPSGQCECGSYESEEVDAYLPDMLKENQQLKERYEDLNNIDSSIQKGLREKIDKLEAKLKEIRTLYDEYWEIPMCEVGKNIIEQLKAIVERKS